MILASAQAADAAAMASAHAQSFDVPWDERDFAELLKDPHVFAFVARQEDPAGVVVCRTAAGEAEILTIGVARWARRQGVARALMVSAIGVARQGGSAEMFLEVDVENASAVALYEGLGFARAGLRKAYYDRGVHGRSDALVMRLDLTSIAG
jgi:ribosomal-protein-alanine N-acetyltransferase